MNVTLRDFPGSPAIHWAEGGPAGGSPLLLLHGVTRGWRDWEPMLPVLTREWRVFAVDQRGHGGSGRAGSYFVTDYVADAVRFVRDAVGTPLILHGHSLGAMVAAAVAAELPRFVRGIVLEDPPFHTMGRRIHGTVWQALFAGMREVVRRGGAIEERTNALADIRLPAPGAGCRRLGELRDRTSLRWSAECLTWLDPEVLTPVIAGRWLDRFELGDIFPRIECPVLLLQADPAAGGALTEEDADECVMALRSCHRVSFPGAGHQLHRDHTDVVLRAVREFATRLGPPASASGQP